MDQFPNVRGENEKYLKPPSSYNWYINPEGIGLMSLSPMGNNGSLDLTMRTNNLVVKHVPDSGGGIMTPSNGSLDPGTYQHTTLEN